MPQPRLILVGGFLGAGKTTLLARAAAALARQGHRVGLITNDQAANLVDSAILSATVGLSDRAAEDTAGQASRGTAVQEVAGGCFCCRFGNLISALKDLMSTIEPDIIFGEPVGSCTDLSATVLQPLKALYGELFRIAPFSVLVDPTRLRESLGHGGERGEGRGANDECRMTNDESKPNAESMPNAECRDASSHSSFVIRHSSLPLLHIFRTQLEEADLILLNKADTLTAAELGELKALIAERVPETPVLAASALRGDGVEAWLDWVLGDRPAGQHLARVDYDIYADGEAELGWLNASIRLQAQGGADWRGFCARLLGRLRDECRAASAEIAHIKLVLTAAGSQIVANLTRTDGEPSILPLAPTLRVLPKVAAGAADESSPRGSVGASAEAELVVNARVRIAPERLRALFARALEVAGGETVRATVLSLESFAPARPRPTHRYGAVV
jgi:G3E family GTPase